MSREAEQARRALLGLPLTGPVFERCRHATGRSIQGFETSEDGRLLSGCPACLVAAEETGADPNIDGADLYS